MSTYVIGDVHGEVTLLQRLLDNLALTTVDTLIFLGDYLDRGEDSVATLQLLADLSVRQRCVFLRGNHDAAWLEVWNGSAFKRCPAIPGAQAVWERHRGLVPPFVGRFLAQSQLYHEDDHAYYSHAGALPGVPFLQSPPEVYVWGMQGFVTSIYDWGKPVVFGHYEFEEPLITRTKIGLDTAAYRTGVLTAMRMQDQRIMHVTLQVIRPATGPFA